ncbi:conserved hypothetical protein [Nesidiocoris tenuis]|uniref:PHD-type domain-containing protein n=2 Tax=Nesidiocoris tenuis TaxID=355587 RepID=A0ABN7AK95_9HEMI|nr:conserved hypothetical protein [Nesidiocoris tenuis]
MECAKCSQELTSPKKTAKCSVCDSSFHPSCTRIKNLDTYKQMNKDRRSKWKCDACKAKSAKSVKPAVEEDSSSESDSNDQVNVAAVLAKLSRQVGALASVPTDVADLKKSVEFMSSQFDVFVADMAKMKSDVQKLESENQKLKSSVDNLQTKVDYLEQESRRMNIEVHGVPETRNEDCEKIVKDLASFLEVDIDLKRAFRAGPMKSDRSRKILVELKSEESREAIANAAKRNEELVASRFSKSWPSKRIYINENLTGYRANLLHQTKMFAKQANYKYVWIKNYNVYMRKTEGDRAIKVNKIEDLSLHS